jgi:hypothetical protein
MRRVLAPGGVFGLRESDYARLLFAPEASVMRDVQSLRRRVREANGVHSRQAHTFRALLRAAGIGSAWGAESCGARRDATGGARSRRDSAEGRSATRA